MWSAPSQEPPVIEIPSRGVFSVRERYLHRPCVWVTGRLQPVASSVHRRSDLVRVLTLPSADTVWSGDEPTLRWSRTRSESPVVGSRRGHDRNSQDTYRRGPGRGVCRSWPDFLGPHPDPEVGPGRLTPGHADVRYRRVATLRQEVVPLSTRLPPGRGWTHVGRKCRRTRPKITLGCRVPVDGVTKTMDLESLPKRNHLDHIMVARLTLGD